MKGFIQQIILVVAGLASILAGLAGLILPFLPGILLIVVGLILISMLHPLFEEWLDTRVAKYPPVHAMVKNLRAFIGRIIKKK